MNSNFIEIFLSLQGEGIYIGTKQLFIRFAECNLNCSYCDTKTGMTNNCKIYYNIDDTDNYHNEPNPIDIKTIIKIISDFNKYDYSYISITGGEPLLHSNYLKKILPEMNKKVILETNGTLPDELSEIIEFIDIISMDFKFNSVTDENIDYEVYKKFISISEQNELYIKLIINNKLTEKDIESFIKIVSNKQYPVIIQPVSENNLIKKVDIIKALNLQTILLKYFNDVRVIPQIHKILNLM